MMIQTFTSTYTLAQYRRLEETAEERHEYHDGALMAMTGGTLEHSQIALNMCALLKMALRQTEFKPFNRDLRVWIPQYRRGVYPDVMVIAGEPSFNDDRRDEVLNPILIVEVLSDSTEAYDRGDKFKYYRSIPEFCEYLLVSQYQPVIDQYVKTNQNAWLMRSHEGLKAAIHLETINVDCSADDIFEDVIFSNRPSK